MFSSFGFPPSLPTCTNLIGTTIIPESDSLSVLVLVPLPLSFSLLPKCLYNPNMRIPKKPVSFCLSLFSPDSYFPPTFSSRIRFVSGTLFKSDSAPGIRKGICCFTGKLKHEHSCFVFLFVLVLV